MQVYAIVFCPDAKLVLVCKKKLYGVFFQRRFRRPKRLNCAGCFCFPGGTKNTGESTFDGAAREFLEETGVNLNTAGDKKVFGDSENNYKGVVFCYSESEFHLIYTEVSINLNVKSNAIAKHDLSGCPIEDDELESVEMVKLRDLENKFTTAEVDWFKDLSEQLKDWCEKNDRIILEFSMMPDFD